MWRRVVMVLSGVVSFTGVLSVVLTTKRRLSCFFWGEINSIVYGVYAMAFGIAGDAQVNIFVFVPAQFFGAYAWSRKMNLNEQVAAERLGLVGWLACVACAGVLSVIFYYEIPAFARALVGSYYLDPDLIGTQTPLLLDSVSSACNVVAQVLLVRRRVEQWVFWLTVDFIQIYLWSGGNTFLPSFNLIFMYTLFIINAMFGVTLWAKASCEKGEGVGKGGEGGRPDVDVDVNGGKNEGETSEGEDSGDGKGKGVGGKAVVDADADVDVDVESGDAEASKGDKVVSREVV